MRRFVGVLLAVAGLTGIACEGGTRLAGDVGDGADSETDRSREDVADTPLPSDAAACDPPPFATRCPPDDPEPAGTHPCGTASPIDRSAAFRMCVDGCGRGGSGGRRAQVAASATEYLVAWSDEASCGVLRAARINADGELIDRPAIVVGGNGYWARVASDGTDFLVVWIDYGPDLTGDGGIVAGRISAAGEVLGLTTLPWGAGRVDVAWTGENYLAVWQELDGAMDSSVWRGARVATDGRVLDPDGITFGSSAGLAAEVRVAGGEGQALVVFSRDREGSFATRVDADGTMLDPTGLDLPSPRGDAQDVVRTPSGYLLVRVVSPVAGDVVAIGADGSVRAGGELPAGFWGASASWEGTEALVTSLESGSLGLCRVTADGAVLGCDHPAIVAGGDMPPGVASVAGASLVVHDDDWFRGANVMSVRVVAGRLVPESRQLVSVGPSTQANPAVTAGAGHPVAVWCDTSRRATGWHVYARVLDPDDAANEVTILGHSAEAACLSAVTAHAGGSLAVWIGEDSAVHATRLDSAGHVIGSPDLELGASVASPYVRPAAAWNGERSLVAWAGGAALVEADGGTHAIDIDGCADVRVAPDGSGFLLLCMQSEPSPIPGGPGRSWTDSVTVTSSGTIGTRSLLVSAFVDAVIEDSGGQLVVWSECGGVYPETCRSRIARLEDGGLVPDSMVLFPESLVGAVVFALVRDPVGVLLAWLGDAGHATLARWDGTALGPPVEVDAAPSVSSGIALDASPTTPPIVVYEVGGLVYGRFLSL